MHWLFQFFLILFSYDNIIEVLFGSLFLFLWVPLFCLFCALSFHVWWSLVVISFKSETLKSRLDGLCRGGRNLSRVVFIYYKVTGQESTCFVGEPPKVSIYLTFLWWHLVSPGKKLPTFCLGVAWDWQHSGSQLDEQGWDLILQDVYFLLGPLFLIQWLSYILPFLMSSSLEPIWFNSFTE